jgi:hypothetical protein
LGNNNQLVNGFAKPTEPNILGMLFNHSAGKGFSQTLILRLENKPPFGEGSLGYLCDVDLGTALKIGAGLDLYRGLFKKKTHDYGESEFFELNGQAIVNSWQYNRETGSRFSKLAHKSREDSLAYLTLNTATDTIKAQSIGHQIANFEKKADEAISKSNLVDSIQAERESGGNRPEVKSFHELRVHAAVYASLDFKFLFPFEIFSQNDMILFGEAVILGVKNFPVLYTDAAARTPISFGFNLPTFKMANLIQLEWEYFPHNDICAGEDYRYDFGTWNSVMQALYNRMSNKNQWRWSIFIEKCFPRILTLQARCMKSLNQDFKHLFRRSNEMRIPTYDWSYFFRLIIRW